MKPMLAGKTEGKGLGYPLIASPKLDGIRALVLDGVLVSRNLKPIPNEFTQKLFGRHELNGLDGELIVGKPTAPDAFRTTTSGVMSVDGEPDVTFHVFDHYDPYTEPAGYKMRIEYLAELFKHDEFFQWCENLKLLGFVFVNSEKELAELEERWLAEGYEGVMLRSFEGPYKEGRSTAKEGYLLKLKRFEDSEAMIMGFQERMHNANEATKDELGRTKRSSHKANKHGTGVLGALHVRDMFTEVEFDVGTGFDDALRAELWGKQETLLGKLIKYRFFPTGSKDKPRFPVFLGFRDVNDM